MILRSGRRLGCDNLSIDFDNAKKEWRKNKQSTGQGMYRYSFFNKRHRCRSLNR